MTASPTSSAKPPPREGSADSDSDSGRVLVIDDSPTILKVVRAILETKGYTVEVARDGTEGFARLHANGGFDLVLLDFVMPRMNGYQFCRELRADEQLKRLPVVLMSARTRTIGDRFVEQTGAVDALDKPFDPRALIAVVGSVIAKQAGTNHLRSIPSPEMMMDEEDLGSAVSVPPPPSRHFRGLGQIASVVARALSGPLSQLRPHDLGQPQIVEDTIANCIVRDVIEDIVAAADDVDLSSNVVLRGQLSKVPLAEVLQLLQLRHQTGVVRVRHQRKLAVLSLREGMVDLAQSTGTDEEFRIGRYFIEAGLMTRQQVELTHADKPSEQLFGEYLLAEGKISDEQLYTALAKQSAELTYEVLRWPDGRFTLSEEPFSDEATAAELGLNLSGLVLEGFRRVDEWRLMADTINFDTVLVIDQVALGALDDSDINKNERQVLMAIDGQRTAREVMEGSHLASFDAIKVLYQYLQSRIVREMTAKGSASVDSAVDSTREPKPPSSARGSSR